MIMGMNKNKLKSLSLCFALGAASPFAHAYILPDTDPARFALAIQENLKRVQEFMQNEIVSKMQIEARGKAAEQEVEAMNNGFANMIARIDKAMETLQNIDQHTKAKPVQNACQTIGVQNTAIEVECSQDGIREVVDSQLKQVTSFISDFGSMVTGRLGLSSGAKSPFVASNIAASSSGPVKSDTEKNLDEFYKNLEEAVTRHQAWEKEGKNPFEPSLLLMTETIAPVYSDEELVMALNLASIAYPEYVRKQNSDPKNERDLLNDVRTKNAVELNNGIVANQIALRTAPSDGMPSKMMTMAMPVRLNLDESGELNKTGESWIHKIALNESTTPAEVSKEALLLKGLELNQALESYKSQLRVEAAILQKVLGSVDSYSR